MLGPVNPAKMLPAMIRSVFLSARALACAMGRCRPRARCPNADLVDPHRPPRGGVRAISPARSSNCSTAISSSSSSAALAGRRAGRGARALRASPRPQSQRRRAPTGSNIRRRLPQPAPSSPPRRRRRLSQSAPRRLRRRDGSGRGDAFNPALNPNAPGAPRPLGTSTAATEPPPPVADVPRRRPAPAGRAARSVDAVGTAAPPRRRAGRRLAAAAAGQSERDRRHAGDACRRAIRPRTNTISLTATFCTRTMGSPRTTFRDFPAANIRATGWRRKRNTGSAKACSRASNIATPPKLSLRSRPNTTPPRGRPTRCCGSASRLRRSGEKEAACASLGEVLRKYPRASVEREAERGPGTEACPLLTQAVSRRRSERAVLAVLKICAACARGFRRSGFDGAAGAGGALGESGSSARRNSSPSPSITACGRKPRAKRPRSSGWRAGSACRIARCAGAARSRNPACRKRRATRAIGCWRKPPRAPATPIS